MGDIPDAAGSAPIYGWGMDDAAPAPLDPYDGRIERDPAMRKRALKRIEARRAFRVHATVYSLVMALLVIIWLVSGGGYFWPIWPAAGWGLGLAIHGFSLTWDKEPTEEEIAREAAKLRRKRPIEGPQDR